MNVRLVSCCVALTALCARPQSGNVPERLVPRDEAAAVADFGAFIAGVRNAVKRRDAEFIVAIAAADITNGFDAEPGPQTFRQQRRLDNPSSEFWSVIADLLAHGSAVAGCHRNGPCSVTFPYWYDRFPPELDAAEYGVIKRDDVSLLAKPDPRAPRNGTLSYHIVRFPTELPPGTPANVGMEWTFVETLSGRRGWIRDEHVYQLVEYRMGFDRRNGRWVLAYFLAGD